MEFRGIYTPAITPLNEDMSIDWDGFDAILEHLIAAGVHGIVVGGTTGEYYVHTVEERVETLRRAKDVVAGRVALIGGTGAVRTEDSVSLAKTVAEIGYDALLVTTPPYAQPTRARMRFTHSPSTGRQTCRSCSTTIPAAWLPR